MNEANGKTEIDKRGEVQATLDRRNAQAVFQELRLFRKELQAMNERVDGMQQALAALSARVSAVEATNAQYRARLMGTGPSAAAG